MARRVEPDGNAYFGPFLPASFARRTIGLTHRLFGLRSCNEVITGQRGRPCLEYDIKRCLAPCVATICSPGEYGRAVNDARLLLEGRRDELLADLAARMADAAAGERFEQAAQLRDAIRTVETLRDRQQKMASTRLGDRDAFGVKTGPAGAAVQVFQVRGGRVVDRVELWTAGIHVAAASEADVLEAALPQFYEAHDPPPEIHVPVDLPESALLEDWLATRAGRKIRLRVPRRGEKRGLLDLASRNASFAYDARAHDGSLQQAEALDTLRVALGLPALPRRIECFDISTIQGSETVAALVVCEDGRMRRGEYRKFRIRGTFGSAVPSGASARAAAHGRIRGDRGVPLQAARPEAEAPGLRSTGPGHARGAAHPRRLRVDARGRAASLSQGRGSGRSVSRPDRHRRRQGPAVGCLRRRCAAIGLERLVAIGLAKQEELVFTRDAADAIAFPRESAALRLLQRIRDEAHRFAVTFHRRARAKRDLRSGLDDVPGIGSRRRKLLLTRFGSLAGVRRATREELTSVVGSKAADAILGHFR